MIPIKTKVDDPFIYFFAEPNFVFVYRIETQEYVTMSDFIDGPHKFETFEISHEDDFEAFDHREIQLIEAFDHGESQPIEGRGFFINQDGMNEMIEEINIHIQKTRQVKGLGDQPDVVHLVASEWAAGSLRFGLKKPNTVIGFPDSFSIGPLWKLDEKVGRSFRKEWLFDNINYELEGYENDNKISNTLREIEDIAGHTAIYIWYGNNAEEQIALRFFLYLLRGKTNAIFLVNSTELYERYGATVEGPAIFHTGQLDQEVLSRFSENNKSLSNNERIQFRHEWEKLSETKDVLRIWMDDEIQTVPEHHYDPFILKTLERLHNEQATKDFIMTGIVLGEIVDSIDGHTDIFFLEYRIRYLVYSGVLELKGIPKSMRHYRVKIQSVT